MKVQGTTGRKTGEVGLTVSCYLQSKYQPEDSKKRVQSASCTLHTKLKPKQVIKKIKELFNE